MVYLLVDTERQTDRRKINTDITHIVITILANTRLLQAPPTTSITMTTTTRTTNNNNNSNNKNNNNNNTLVSEHLNSSDIHWKAIILLVAWLLFDQTTALWPNHAVQGAFSNVWHSPSNSWEFLWSDGILELTHEKMSVTHSWHKWYRLIGQISDWWVHAVRGKVHQGGGNRGKEGVKTKIMFDFREACGAYVWKENNI